MAIRQNEFFTLLGPSGCGKTTLLRLIAGFEAPSAGHILLDGADIARLPPYRRPVNTVFQNYALFPHLTVAENVAFGLQMLRSPRRRDRAPASSGCWSWCSMDADARPLTSQISGGQQQRVALARALAPAPQVLLLDEPLSALDYKLRKEMQIELKRLQHETGITFVFVTHDQEEALTMSDRIAVMSAGRILQIGTPHDIYDRPSERFVADFIGETNFLEGAVAATIERPAAGGARLRRHARGRDARAAAAGPRHPGGPPRARRPGQGRRAVRHRRDAGDRRLCRHRHPVPRPARRPATASWSAARTAAAQAERFAAGEAVGIRLEPDAAQVLRD